MNKNRLLSTPVFQILCLCFLLAAYSALYADDTASLETHGISPDTASVDSTADANAADTTAKPAALDLKGKKIVALSFSGNRTTREKVLRLFLQSMGIDTGAAYDSATIAYAKQKLRLTNYYSKVDILPLLLDGGVHLYIILNEVFYVNPDGFGGSLESRRHGNSDEWYRLNFGLTLNNFRGMMENFSVAGTIWDDRGLSLSWTKPLYPSPYSFGLGAGIAHVQDLNFPQDRRIAYGRVSVGRRLTLHSQGGIGLAPTYTIINALDGASITKFSEFVTSLRWFVDFRNDTYDPIHGWSLSAVLSTNAAYTDDMRKYGQLTTDGKWYAHVFFKHDRLAFHTQTVFRSNDAGEYKRLSLGGDGSVRGFATGELGLIDTMNNSAAVTSEYRFRLYTTPVIDFGYLSRKMQELQSLYYEVDGALIADVGTLWRSFSSPLNKRQDGAGIGFGLNIKVPTLRITGCIDAVWPIFKVVNPASSFYNKTILWRYPNWHVYLSTF